MISEGKLRVPAIWESGHTSQPFKLERGRMIPFPHRHEFPAQVTTGIYMPHYRVGPDLSLLDLKFNLSRCSMTLVFASR